MMKKFDLFIAAFILFSATLFAQEVSREKQYEPAEILNKKANGFKGIWYMNQPSHDEYVYKYSGGMGTYCAKHRPFAVYSDKANKTFFCFGGTNAKNSTLLHNVSCYDHETGKVTNPTIVLDKKTNDAHDNPVISLDDEGYIWIFSTAHGTGRPSYISKSINPFDISKFEIISATEIVDGKEVPFDNFSYFQVWYVKGHGFMAFLTKYQKGGRVIGFNTSKNGKHWGEWKVIAHIGRGHYQVSRENNGILATAFNYHPEEVGLNYRTNLYYIKTSDFGENWYNGEGEKVQLPLKEINNKAIVKDFETEGLKCYMKDVNFDSEGNPIVMVISSKGYESGPENGPRKWEVFHYSGENWENHVVTTSDNNYDMGPLYVEDSGTWRVIGPMESGPQPYNTGGEIVMRVSNDNGKTWLKEKQLTCNSPMNHNYVRRPLNANSDFYAIWADGHGRQPSESSIFFCNKNGDVFKLPRDINEGQQTIIPEIFKN